MSIKYLISKLILKIQIPAIKNSKIDKNSKIGPKSQIVNSSIDQYSYTGQNCTILNSQIGKFCSIANNVIIGGAAHPVDWVSTSPVFHNKKNTLKKNYSIHYFKTSNMTKINNDIWIGNNCLIKSGVEISSGAVIGMGSVVTKNIGPYEIWAGNPAKLIRKRFSDETIEKLLKSEWWNQDDICLRKKAKNIMSVDRFLEGEEDNR